MLLLLERRLQLVHLSVVVAIGDGSGLDVVRYRAYKLWGIFASIRDNFFDILLDRDPLLGGQLIILVRLLDKMADRVYLFSGGRSDDNILAIFGERVHYCGVFGSCAQNGWLLDPLLALLA